MHEIQFAEQEIRGNEDKILDLMVNAEARDKHVKAAEAELKAEAAEIEKEKADARQRTAEDEKLLAEWSGKRDKLREGVNSDVLRHYERVLKFRGSGLSEVRDQKCMTCRVLLRPQTYNEVRAATPSSSANPASASSTSIPKTKPASSARPSPPSAAPAQAGLPAGLVLSPVLWRDRRSFSGVRERFDQLDPRVYELHTGRQVGDILSREGSFRLRFQRTSRA